MGRIKIKPEIDEQKLGLNPLVGEDDFTLRIPVRKRERKVINKFKEPDVMEFYTESQPYTKLYEVAGYKDLMMSLPLRAKELLLYIIHYVEVGSDHIWINRKDYMDRNGIKSINTFKMAVAQLSYKRYVCPHILIKDLLWINPKYFFKGDRIGKYPNHLEILKSKSKK